MSSFFAVCVINQLYYLLSNSIKLGVTEIICGIFFIINLIQSTILFISGTSTNDLLKCNTEDHI